MLTIKQISQKIAKGRSGGSGNVTSELDSYYKNIKDRIVETGCKKDKDSITLYFNIPSSKEDIFYDVAIQIFSITDFKPDTTIKVFSNSPLFAYNFAYIFNREGSMLFPGLLPSEFSLLPPKSKNPFGLFTFDKHIYSMLKYIKEKKFRSFLKTCNGKVPKVMSFDEKKKELEAPKKKSV